MHFFSELGHTKLDGVPAVCSIRALALRREGHSSTASSPFSGRPSGAGLVTVGSLLPGPRTVKPSISGEGGGRLGCTSGSLRPLRSRRPGCWPRPPHAGPGDLTSRAAAQAGQWQLLQPPLSPCGCFTRRPRARDPSHPVLSFGVFPSSLQAPCLRMWVKLKDPGPRVRSLGLTCCTQCLLAAKTSSQPSGKVGTQAPSHGRQRGSGVWNILGMKETAV